MSGFQSLPKGTRLRIAAAAILTNGGTIAGNTVKDSPLDPVQPADYPALCVFSSESRDTMGAAGGPPIFKVSYTLVIQGLVIAADSQRAILLADTLKWQAFDALMSDPIWPGLVESIATVTEKRNFGADGERKIVEFQLVIVTAWREKFKPANSSPLLADGQPGAIRTIAVPLTKIVNTQQLGTDAEGHETLFVVDTNFSS